MSIRDQFADLVKRRQQLLLEQGVDEEEALVLATRQAFCQLPEYLDYLCATAKEGYGYG